MSLTKEQVKKIAKLGRIRLKAEQEDEFTGEINQILDWVTMLQEVNTDGVEQMTSVVNVSLPMREDKITDGDIQEDVLANAPDAKFGCYVVPKVVE